MDRISSELRSFMMSRIRSSNTRPEWAVRRLLHSLGYRYRLHDRTLPGSPDIVFRGRRKVVFVNGCFWHRHQGCRLATTPKTRPEYWAEKFRANVARDNRVNETLRKQGWTSLTVWECEIKRDDLASRLRAFLDGSSDASDASDAIDA